MNICIFSDIPFPQTRDSLGNAVFCCCCYFFNASFKPSGLSKPLTCFLTLTDDPGIITECLRLPLQTNQPTPTRPHPAFLAICSVQIPGRNLTLLPQSLCTCYRCTCSLPCPFFLPVSSAEPALTALGGYGQSPPPAPPSQESV